MGNKKTSDILSSLDQAQKVSMDQVGQKIHYLKKLLEVSRRISTLDIKTAVRLIMDSVLAIIQGQRGFLMLFDDDKRLRVEFASGLNEELLTQSQQFEICRSIARHVADVGEGELIDNVVEDKRYKDRHSVIELQLKAMMCVPLKTKDKIIGVIYVDSDRREHHFSYGDLELFEAFASQAAIAIENARLFEQIKKENVFLHKEIQGYYQFDEIVCESEKMRQICQMVGHVLNNSINVLIQGETGTGKELIARAIHYNSTRKDKPFIAQNCGALSETLLESELFGYKKGAFTGAVEDKIGIFEAADGGTILLDEIGETSSSMQVALLRVLETGMVRRVGDTVDRKIDVRILAATNRDLEKEAKEGQFRADLFYRLNVFPIHLPPLRERKEDIPFLVQHFIEHFNKKLKKDIHSVSEKTMGMLMEKNWNGNIRELKNFIYRMMVLSPPGELLYKEDKGKIEEKKDNDDERAPFKTLHKMEKEYIESVLEYVQGNQAKAARILGLKRSTLRSRLKKFKEL